MSGTRPALAVGLLLAVGCSDASGVASAPVDSGARPAVDGGAAASEAGVKPGAPPGDDATAPAPEDAGGDDAAPGAAMDAQVAPIDAAGRTPPTCATPTPSPNGARPGECDYLLQSLDLEDSFGYPSPAGAVKITNYGAAFGLSEINGCSPYCYAKNLTVGVDIVGGGAQAALQGEILLELPATGPDLPIAAADATRNGLAWITFDGPSKPPFEIDTQLVLETSSGIVPAMETKAFFKAGGRLNPFGPFSVANNYSYGNGSEFKYFPMTSASGFPSAPANVTGIGFRIVAKAAAGQEWHGVAYIDHVQVRGGGADNPTDAGAYPYGL